MDYPRLPALERLFRLLDALPGSEVRVRLATPQGAPEAPTLYLAPEGGSPLPVLLTAPHPLLEGVALLGERLPPPPPPKGPWRPLAEGEGGVGLLYAAEGGLYLPPLETIQDRPFFPLLVYNFLKPYREARTGLLAPEETLLPTPEAGFLPRERGGRGAAFRPPRRPGPPPRGLALRQEGIMGPCASAPSPRKTWTGLTS